MHPHPSQGRNSWNGEIVGIEAPSSGSESEGVDSNPVSMKGRLKFQPYTS